MIESNLEQFCPLSCSFDVYIFGWYNQYPDTNIYNIMYTGSLNDIYDDNGAGIRFAILFDYLANTFPEEKFQQLKDLIQSNVSMLVWNSNAFL